MILVLHLKGAFYKAVLHAVFQLPHAPEEPNELLRDINMPEPFLSALQLAMEGARILNYNLDDEHLCALLQDAHTDTWTAAKGSTRLAQPRSGTRPGAPASDLAVNCLFAWVTRHIAEAMTDSSL
eukprot:2734931-Pyramimonas_sp.AAC.1